MFEIEPATGLVCMEDEDFSLRGDASFFFKRRYVNLVPYVGPFGLGWAHDFAASLTWSPGSLTLLDGEARRIRLPAPVEGGRVEAAAEGLVAEALDDEVVVHRGGGKSLVFSREPLRDGRLPLVRIDETDEESTYFSYRADELEEIRTTTGHRLRVSWRRGRIERIALRLADGEDVPLATYGYGPGGELLSVTDADGNARAYEYSDGLLTRYTNPLRGSYYLEYDGSRRATAIWQDGLHRLRQVLYDDRRGARLVVDALGHATHLVFNANGLLERATRFDGSRVERAYAAGSEPIAVFGIGPESAWGYDPAAGAVTETDPDGGTSTVTFDDLGRVVEEGDPDGAVTRYEYDERNRIVRQVEPLGGVHELEFDEAGRLMRHRQPLGNEVRANRSRDGRLALRDRLGPLYISEHDAFGNTVRIIAPSGRTTRFEYDHAGRLTVLRTGGAEARNWYDANGQLAGQTDLLGNRTTYERDPFGLLLAWTNPMGRRIEYAYDAERRLIGGRSSDGLECSYAYDFRGRLIRMRLRDDRVETISYDADGRRTIFSGSDGQATRYSYTPSGRLCGIESPTGRARFEFDPGGNCVLAETEHRAVIREWAPDARLLAEAQGDFRVEYEHNLAGQVVLRRDPTGRECRYEYDLRGELERAVDTRFGAFEIVRDDRRSQVAQRLPNGVVKSFEYGEDDELARAISRSPSGDVACERSYRYAPNGELLEARTEGAEALRFRYDAAYQLTRVEGPGEYDESFDYDHDHNIIRDARRGRYEFDRTYLVAAGDLRYEYDRSGRVATRRRGDQSTTFRYGLGGLIAAATLPDGTEFEYEYDAYGRRVVKRGPDLFIQYDWDQDVLLHQREETPAGTRTIEYFFRPGSYIPIGHAVDGVCFYYEMDQRGLIREVYDAEGRVVARFAYSAFGLRRTLELADVAADPQFRLQGQLFDPETGLHYNRFRYFDAEVGRYLSPDLSTHQIEHNSYSYGPNPINWADPLGLMARFSQSDALSFVEESAAEDGFFECSGCGFKNKNRVFARSAETGRPVGDGSFQAGHRNAHARGGSANINRNAQVEGGTCNCSKGKRKTSGMT